MVHFFLTCKDTKLFRKTPYFDAKKRRKIDLPPVKPMTPHLPAVFIAKKIEIKTAESGNIW
jgi:hypothetical protein